MSRSMVVVKGTKKGQISAQLVAQAVQEQIKEWAEQYPNVVCYCFDSFSTLLYVL